MNGATEFREMVAHFQNRVATLTAHVEKLETALRVCAEAYATFGPYVVVEPEYGTSEIVEIEAFVHDVLGCGGPPDGQLTIAAGQVPQPGPVAAPTEP